MHLFWVLFFRYPPNSFVLASIPMGEASEDLKILLKSWGSPAWRSFAHGLKDFERKTILFFCLNLFVSFFISLFVCLFVCLLIPSRSHCSKSQSLLRIHTPVKICWCTSHRQKHKIWPISSLLETAETRSLRAISRFISKIPRKSMTISRKPPKTQQKPWKITRKSPENPRRSPENHQKIPKKSLEWP